MNRKTRCFVFVRIFSVAVCVMMVTACNKIKPWERNTLAHPCMTDTNRPEEQFARQHMLGARESTQGGAGETGGGCGCN